MKTFKKLLSQIVQVQTVEEFYEACGAVDNAFFHHKISAEDHQLLHRVIDLMGMTISLH